jgi:phosphopantothenoylcysteine decarboxylase/phosphopantothenate--cysteine ligase
MSRSREIVLGIGGGIAAYKSADLLRRLKDRGYLVTVVPTPSSLNFVGAATWEALSGRTVTTQVWEKVEEVRHISLAQKATSVLIAPATADLIARMAMGRADDLLTNIILATQAPIFVVPAMHPQMWLNASTQENVAVLRGRGIFVMEPDTGRLTGEDIGQGRFPDTSSIISEFERALGFKQDLQGKKVLVSAGGTREPIDPVRYIGNRSSGKQGIAIAKAAYERGAEVCIVLANSNLPVTNGIEVIHVETAEEMASALKNNFENSDFLFMSAAVADARPQSVAGEKIKKVDYQSIELKENPDILVELSSMKTSQRVVAFAAETDSDQLKALEKMRAKGADIIYLNNVSDGAIFGEDRTSGVIMVKGGAPHTVQDISKDTLGHLLLDLASNQLGLSNV